MKKEIVSAAIFSILVSGPVLGDEPPPSNIDAALKKVESSNAALAAAKDKGEKDVDAKSKELDEAVKQAQKLIDQSSEKIKQLAKSVKANDQAIDCEDQDGAAFNNFSGVSGSEVQFVSSDVISAYTQIGDGTKPGSRVGLRVSTSLPVKIDDQKRYVDHELQLRDGGIANLAFSIASTGLFVSKPAQAAPTAPAADGVPATVAAATPPAPPKVGCLSLGRTLKVDRHYFGLDDLSDQSNSLFYWSNGIGVRGVKRADAADKNEKTSAAGFAYIGFGIDGALKASKGGEGYFDFSARVTYNRVNKDFMAPLYGGSTIENVLSASVALKFNVTSAVAASIEYSTPIGGAKSYGMNEIALISLTYAPTKDSGKKDEASGDSGVGATTPTDSGNSAPVTPKRKFTAI